MSSSHRSGTTHVPARHLAGGTEEPAAAAGAGSVADAATGSRARAGVRPPGHRGSVPAVELRGVRAGYGGAAVVHGVDLAVATGEILGLLGPNGAGKTTLLRCLTGRISPGTGHVLVCGADVAGLAPRDRARRLAVVPQRFELPGGFTVRELVAMGRSPHLGLLSHETSRDWQVVDRTLRDVGVDHLAGRPVGELSGGEEQKVMLATALAQEPAVLVLDEPTAHLDLRHQAEVMALLRRLRDRRRVTVVAVVHDLNLAARHCDRVALLVDGAIAATGTPREVMEDDLLSACFGTRLRVLRDPATGDPVIVPALPADAEGRAFAGGPRPAGGVGDGAVEPVETAASSGAEGRS